MLADRYAGSDAPPAARDLAGRGIRVCTIAPGTFIWFQSIDNGEGAGAPPDLSTISGFGDEAANEAFCNAATVPNPNFGPHPVSGNIEVRP